jgi:hypothetical protein
MEILKILCYLSIGMASTLIRVKNEAPRLLKLEY